MASFGLTHCDNSVLDLDDDEEEDDGYLLDLDDEEEDGYGLHRNWCLGQTVA